MTPALAKIVAVLCSIFTNICLSNAALIISSPLLAARQSAEAKLLDGLKNENKVGARIRSVRRSDVDDVSDLLASALIENTGVANFQKKIEQLRIKSALQSNLDLRVRAMAEGKRFFDQRIGNNENSFARELEDPNHLRYLWSNDSFRIKVQQAAEQSNEPHPWEYHNFAMIPENPHWLRHAALAAENIDSGELIGFCEIAMLLCPTGKQTEDDGLKLDYADDYEEDCCSLDCSPTIANLVVSPSWRGCGVAFSLLKSAERLIQRGWKCGELCLYVEKNNQRAIRLYLRAGFQMKSVRDDKLYMSKSLECDNHSRIIRRMNEASRRNYGELAMMQ